MSNVVTVRVGFGLADTNKTKQIITFNTGVNNSAKLSAVPFTVLMTFCMIVSSRLVRCSRRAALAFSRHGKRTYDGTIVANGNGTGEKRETLDPTTTGRQCGSVAKRRLARAVATGRVRDDDFGTTHLSTTMVRGMGGEDANGIRNAVAALTENANARREIGTALIFIVVHSQPVGVRPISARDMDRLIAGGYQRATVFGR